MLPLSTRQRGYRRSVRSRGTSESGTDDVDTCMGWQKRGGRLGHYWPWVLLFMTNVLRMVNGVGIEVCTL